MLNDNQITDKEPSQSTEEGSFHQKIVTNSNLSNVKQGEHTPVDRAAKTLIKESLHIGRPVTSSNLNNPISDKISGSTRDVTLTMSPEDMAKEQSTLLLLDHPEITKEDRLTSFDIINQMRSKGADIQDVPLNLYRAGTLGSPKHFSWDVELKGYPNLYSDVEHFKSIVDGVKRLARRLAAKVRPITEDSKHNEHLIALSEWPDTQAIGMIRTKSIGWFLDPVFSLDIMRSNPSILFERVLDRVAAKYASVLKNPVKTDNVEIPSISLSTDDATLRLVDSDPTDTLVGLPTMASQEETIPTRVLMLALSPDFKNSTGAEWLSKYRNAVANGLSIPSFMALAVSIANRTSASRKSFRSWELGRAGYISNSSVKGLGARVRNVFPVPFVLNYALSPLYVQLSHARKNIPGLWHDPESWDKMVKNLTSNKDHVIMSADFSGMDQHMSPSLIAMIGRTLHKRGFSKFASSIMSVIQDEISILAPSMIGAPRSVTKISSVIPWLSGFKLTSEFDTIYGLAATLTAMSQQTPLKDIVDKWERGEFIIYELGDDTIFSLPSNIYEQVDWDKFTDDAMKLVGADIKRDDAPVFLKRIILRDGSSPRMLSRVIQQTFFNESRSDGLPAIVSLVGFKARVEGLDKHPWYAEFREEFEDIVLQTVFAKELNLTRADLKPDSPMTPNQLAALLTYAESLDGLDWISSLIEQAKYSHAAAEALALIPMKYREQSINKDRKLYAEALSRSITPAEITILKNKVANYLT